MCIRDRHKAVALALEMGAPLENLTFSSDGRGGVKKIDPVTGEVTYTPAPLDKNLKEMIKLVKERILPLELSLIHISEPTRLLSISYAVFCLKKKKQKNMQKNEDFT